MVEQRLGARCRVGIEAPLAVAALRLYELRMPLPDAQPAFGFDRVNDRDNRLLLDGRGDELAHTIHRLEVACPEPQRDPHGDIGASPVCVESPRAERVGARRRTFGAVDEDGHGAFNIALQVANVLEICGSEWEGDMA